MQEIDNMVQRIRELIVYAANDTQEVTAGNEAQSDRQKIQDEINQLMQEIDSMATRVEFNKKKLIDGTYAEGNPKTPSGIESTAALLDAVNANYRTLSVTFTAAAASFTLMNDAMISAVFFCRDISYNFNRRRRFCSCHGINRY
jgi:flagellin